jgi:hypothetical protein
MIRRIGGALALGLVVALGLGGCGSTDEYDADESDNAAETDYGFGGDPNLDYDEGEMFDDEAEDKAD